MNLDEDCNDGVMTARRCSWDVLALAPFGTALQQVLISKYDVGSTFFAFERELQSPHDIPDRLGRRVKDLWVLDSEVTNRNS